MATQATDEQWHRINAVGEEHTASSMTRCAIMNNSSGELRVFLTFSDWQYRNDCSLRIELGHLRDVLDVLTELHAPDSIQFD